MTIAGVLVIDAKRYRSQEQNRTDSEQRLKTIIQKALISPKRRKPTHPTATSQIRRLKTKKYKGNTKDLRQSIDE